MNLPPINLYRMAKKMTDTYTIYEVIDLSNDDMYFTLGFYLDFDTAKQALLKRASENNAITEWGRDGYDVYETIAIRERKIGWTDTCKDVLKIKRENQYIEATDEYKWVTIDEKHNP